eukprot:9236055-Alexandrium_andersonii.AAC.1
MRRMDRELRRTRTQIANARAARHPPQSSGAPAPVLPLASGVPAPDAAASSDVQPPMLLPAHQGSQIPPPPPPP